MEARDRILGELSNPSRLSELSVRACCIRDGPFSAPWCCPSVRTDLGLLPALSRLSSLVSDIVKSNDKGATTNMFAGGIDAVYVINAD